MRRAAGEKPAAQRVNSPLVRYDNDGKLHCKVCHIAVGSDSLWPAHQASAQHMASVVALKQRAGGGAGAGGASVAPKKAPDAVQSLPSKPVSSSTSLPADFFDDSSRKSTATPHAISASAAATSTKPVAAPRPQSVAPAVAAPSAALPDAASSSSASSSTLNVSASAARASAKVSAADVSIMPAASSQKGNAANANLPAGFFDDIESDLKARGIDPKAVAKAAEEAEWAEFQSFAAEVATSSAEAQAEEEARYEERSQLADVENALYKARLGVVQYVRDKLLSKKRGRDESEGAEKQGGPQTHGSSSLKRPRPSDGRNGIELNDQEEDGSDGVMQAELAGSLSLLTSSGAAAAVSGAGGGASSWSSSSSASSAAGLTISAEELSATLQKRWSKNVVLTSTAAGAAAAAAAAAAQKPLSTREEAGGDAGDEGDDDDGDYLALVDWRRKQL